MKTKHHKVKLEQATVQGIPESLLRTKIRQCKEKPNAAEIAAIAAQLTRNGVPHKAAIIEALELWIESNEEIQRLSGPRGPDWFHPTYKHNGESVTLDIPKPHRFPVSLREMLICIIPPPTKDTERYARFRRYLAHENGSEEAGVNRMDELGNRPINSSEYLMITTAYELWWRQELSQTRKAARAKRGKKPLASKSP